MMKIILYLSRDRIRYLANRIAAISLFLLTNAIFLVAVHAQDSQTLHSENCIACHAAMTGGDGSVLYTRDDRAVKSTDALSKQVDRCQASLNLNWSNDQISSVQQYLNTLFYHF